jgi:hypothetical protein
LISIADSGCLSRIPDPIFIHPGSRIFFPTNLFSLLPIVGALTLVLSDNNLLRSHITVENQGLFFIFYLLMEGSGSDGDLDPYKYLRIPRIWDLKYGLKPLADYYPLSSPGRRYVDPDLGALGGIPDRLVVAFLFLLRSHLKKAVLRIRIRDPVPF